MDNASNNDRFIRLLEGACRQRNIPFKAVERRIRCVLHSLSDPVTTDELARCFPHIVNLACKAVIAAITNMDYAREPRDEAERQAFMLGINGDAIATLRAFIRAVCPLSF